MKELTASTVPSQETIRFTLYQDEEGTTPLWSETQQVEVAPLGRYTVLLGAGTEGGIPLPLCISNSAGPQTCACARVLSQTQVSAGQSCSITGLPGSCTATSQGGVPITYGACCVCS